MPRSPLESDEPTSIRRHWLAPHSSQRGPFEGPYAQLAAAFESLQADGIVARMDFACCQNCGHDEIVDERTLVDQNAEYPYRERGYVFFHAQDSDGLAEGSDKLYLAFGAFAGGPLMSPWPSSEPEDEQEKQAFIELARNAETTVGHTVAQTLRDHGLRVDWAGDIRERISVHADWSSVAFPWLREDEGDLELPPADPEQFDNAWYLLLNEEPETLGHIMEDIMPNWSAQLREEQAISGEVPYEDPDLTLKYTLLSKMDFAELAEAAQRSGLPGAVEAVESHQAVLCIAVEGDASPYDQVMYQAALAAEVGNRPEVIGLWVPSQERFEVEVHQVVEMFGKYPYVAIHRTEAEIDSGDGHALYTRGLKRLGLKELAVEDPEELATTDMRNMLLVVVDKIVQSGKVPQAGEEIRTHSRKINALLHDVEDPVTHEPALNVEFIDRKKFLGVF